ncbi:carbohydrate porin [Waterburya agarophytonicola K14]|uniref:Carbohydrate porin n=1 Tax=Waterburya agarophytonicola KI4 TaxID=2874699 RepID=A0A964BSP0_9CYAN|nr:iron uptake porin [Waterburya agarophytonicola]MCC0177818.1 carbohydrate porin [Waterburya agarophytonicola KI4]
MTIVNQTASIILATLVTGIYGTAVKAQVQQYEDNSIGQITNVNQLRDVSPTDWAYEALRSLVDRYGCISGFPNQTYRGNQPLSRYEFAAGLNSCLNQIERLIASQGQVGQEDVDTINRLSQEFEAELASIGGRVDELESRTAVLEDSQFSTTTKLAGEAIFGISDIVAGSNDDGVDATDDDIDSEAVFGYRTRLELETSFTGEDLLFTRLSTGNFPEFADETGTFQGELAFAEPADSDLGLEVLIYDRPLGENTNILIGAIGMAADDIANTVSVLDGDGGSGALSAFGTRSPIYLPPGETGIGLIHSFSDKLEFSVGYLAGEASDPSEEAGLFDGSYSALGQLTITPFEKLNVALTYVHGLDQSDTGVGSDLSNIQSLTTTEVEDGDPPLLPGQFEGGVPTVSDSYGAQFSFALSDRIVIGGWGGLSKVTTLSSFTDEGQTIPRGTQDIWNWAGTLAFPDLLKEGSMGGIIVGMQPWVAKSTIDVEGFDEDEEQALHLEAFYQYQLNDNIAITPGVIYINNPDNNSDNDDLLIGTIRTTFAF